MKVKECPYCNHQFYKAKVVGNNRFCSSCGGKIYYINGGVMDTTEYNKYLADKRCVDDLVQLLIDNVDKRLGITLDIKDLIAERKFAYQLLERSKTFVSKQRDDYNVSPHDFIREVVAEMFNDNYWASTTSFLFIQNSITQFAIRLWREKKKNHQINRAAAQTFSDYRVFAR